MEISTYPDKPVPDALILAGGFGTRLRTVVPDRQKVMASVGSKPFLFYIIEQLVSGGVERITLCLGYKGREVSSAVAKEYSDIVNIRFSIEENPMGTGGAILLASQMGVTKNFFVLNGDSFLAADLPLLYRSHIEEKADVTMALAKVEDSSRYGGVIVDDKKNIISFAEKREKTQSDYINGGIYVFNRSAIDDFPRGAFSLEKEFFPNLHKNRFKGFPFHGDFIDIGTPSDYRKAQSMRL